MPLLTLKNLTLGFGGPPLLNEVDLMLEHGERVSLVGRNGQGKSSLMKLITGEIKPDDGQINFEEGAKLAYLLRMSLNISKVMFLTWSRAA